MGRERFLEDLYKITERYVFSSAEVPVNFELCKFIIDRFLEDSKTEYSLNGNEETGEFIDLRNPDFNCKVRMTNAYICIYEPSKFLYSVPVMWIQKRDESIKEGQIHDELYNRVRKKL